MEAIKKSVILILFFIYSCDIPTRYPKSVIIKDIKSKGVVIDKYYGNTTYHGGSVGTNPTLEIRTDSDVVKVEVRKELFDFLVINDTIK